MTQNISKIVCAYTWLKPSRLKLKNLKKWTMLKYVFIQQNELSMKYHKKTLGWELGDSLSLLEYQNQEAPNITELTISLLDQLLSVSNQKVKEVVGPPSYLLIQMSLFNIECQKMSVFYSFSLLFFYNIEKTLVFRFLFYVQIEENYPRYTNN